MPNMVELTKNLYDNVMRIDVFNDTLTISIIILNKKNLHDQVMRMGLNMFLIIH